MKEDAPRVIKIPAKPEATRQAEATALHNESQ